MVNSMKSKKLVFIRTTERRKVQQIEGKSKVLTLKLSSVLYFILFDTYYGNDILNIGTYRYIQVFWLDLCLYFEHIELSHQDSYVRIWVQIRIDINTIQTHCVVYELENAVNLIGNIDTYDKWKYDPLSAGAWLSVMPYICVAFIVYTIVQVNCWETLSKINCLFLSVTWQSIRSLEQSSANVYW